MPGQRIGYVRVSSIDQNPERQLEQIPLDQVFTDQASGKDTQRRNWKGCSASCARPTRWSCTAWIGWPRNLDDLRRIVGKLTGRGVRIEFVQENLTFTGEDFADGEPDAVGHGGLAEFERALLRERQREGIALASSEGPIGAARKRSRRSRRPSSANGCGPESGKPRWPASSASVGKPSTSTCAQKTDHASSQCVDAR